MNFKDLNQNQIYAINKLNGPILCLAGAGSGKTTTLTYRVANLINNNISPSSILLLTFTKKAAQDMINRINEIIGAKAQNVVSGTFHHFATLIINQFYELLQINKNYSVIDDNDSIDIIKSILSNYKRNNNINISKNLLFQIISKARSYNNNIDEIINRFFVNYSTEKEHINNIFNLYTSFKQENNLLDYDDLLENLYKLLLIPKVNNYLSNQFKYIMVDEYQDTNIIQSNIIYLLSKTNKNIMVVGDDAQSIYSFRGSRIENIQEFTKVFPDSEIIKLDKNYRSDGYILKATNDLISNSKKCLKKTLYTDKNDGNKIILVRCYSESEEALLVSHRIIELYKKGYLLSDMAVLFRNSNYSYELELELNKKCIPYKKIGGKKLFDSDHIRNIICFLRILNNPYDKMSWLKVLMLLKGIGLQTATDIFNYLKKLPEPFDLSGYKIRKEQKEDLIKLSDFLKNSVNLLNKKPVFLLSVIIDYYINMIKSLYPSSQINPIVKQFDQLTILFEKYSTLHEVLSDLFLEFKTNEDSLNLQIKNNDILTLSTIHSAKGLEWKQVFIINALDGRLPSFNSIKNEEELEEERRLMYVAMTRAIKGLMITYPTGIFDNYSRQILSKPSRFLNEINPNSLEIWQIKH